MGLGPARADPHLGREVGDARLPAPRPVGQLPRQARGGEDLPDRRRRAHDLHQGGLAPDAEAVLLGHPRRAARARAGDRPGRDRPRLQGPGEALRRHALRRLRARLPPLDRGRAARARDGVQGDEGREEAALPRRLLQGRRLVHAGGDPQAVRGRASRRALLAGAVLIGSGCASGGPRGGGDPSTSVASQDAAEPEAAEREPASHRFPGPQAGAVAPSLERLVWYRGGPPPAGEPYVLFFWGTWCKPCKKALPTLMTRCGERELPIVAVSRDPVGLLDAFFMAWTEPFPLRVAIDPKPYPVHWAYEAWSVPRFVYVGANGHIDRVVYGAGDLDAL
ncbi:MAG: redoxin domain-containing protein [Deltaproteobacteria bacterium]|nr:MAG: redoxin domain-containing protein [Deltaproteobacteria bacterium]